MSGASFYFHDYETFGTNPQKDRACQFAGLRTDADFTIIGEPLVIFCEPGSERLPHPEACLITGITPQQAQREGCTEARFIEQIHEAISQPMTCMLGYNNFRFDDEFTRNLLYRNLFDPYAHEWKNGNSRFDLIDVVRMMYALRPDGIHWPRHEDGTPSFKLEHLSQANGITHTDAHDALSDVHATIGLAKLLKQSQPKLWGWALSLRSTRHARQLLSHEEPLLHTSGKYRNNRGGTAMVLPLGEHPQIKSQVIVYDLMINPAQFESLSSDELQDLLFTPQADLPDGLERLPIKTVKTNRAPMLAPVTTLRGVDTDRIELDVERCQQHAQTLLKNPLLCQRITAVTGNRNFDDSTDPDTQLYSGFIPDGDRQELYTLRELTPERWPQPLPVFADSRIPELLFRYKARNFPATLTVSEQERWQIWRNQCLNTLTELNLDNYTELLGQLRQGQNPTVLLDQLEAWALELRQSLNSYQLT